MAEALTLQGKLEVVPELLRTMLSNQGTASLTLRRDAAEIQFYFENGHIVYAGSNDPDLGLADVLLSRGELSLDQYFAILEQLRHRKSPVEAMTESGTLSPDELLHAFEAQAHEILNEAFRWTSGAYTMVLDARIPSEVTGLNLNTERLVLQAMRRIPRFTVLKRGLGSFHRTLVQSPGQDSRLYKIDLADEENHIYSLFDAPRSIQEVCAMSYLPNIETLKIVWGLWVLRLLQEGKGEGGKEKAQEEEYALGAMVESYNNAFARIYDLVYQELGDEVEEFVTKIFARLSPDTRKFLEGSFLSDEGRLDYDTIMHTINKMNVPSRPQALMDLMNEILYAWVLEVRVKFGDRLLAEVDKAINEIREE
jgi:hypothetical protein